MATTSTNKQPLLVDRVMHEVVDMNDRKVAKNATTPGNVSGTNSAILLIDSVGGDGALVEDIYTVSRGATEYTINLYFTSATDYLRPDQGVFIGRIKSATTEARKTHLGDMPYILAPVPQAGYIDEAAVKAEGYSSASQRFRALYVPKGKALWAALEVDNINTPITDAPMLGVMGGYY